LKGHGIFGPESAVVVEHGEALGLGNEILRVGVGGFFDEVEEGLLGGAGFQEGSGAAAARGASKTRRNGSGDFIRIYRA
jgi:hypothetical protein